MEKVFQAMAISTLLVFLTFNATGCAKKQIKSDVETPPASSTDQMLAGDQDSRKGIKEYGMAAADEPLDSKRMMGEGGDGLILEGRTHAPLLPVYFDFDRSGIRQDQRPRITKNGDFLSRNQTRIRIEGNCDERGTNEYNMALGERRAMSAKKYLMNLGISENRMDTISYGEERPLQYGHDEYSWAQNRRDDFIILQ